MALDIGIFQINPDMRADPAIVGKAAEDLGFTSYWVPEHAILPVEFESTYVRDRTEEEPPPPPDYLWKMPDPWVTLTRVATYPNDRSRCAALAISRCPTPSG